MAETTYAWIVDGVVREVFALPDAVEGEDGSVPVALADVRPPEIAAACRALTKAQAGKVRVGWLWDGTAFAEPPVEPVPATPRICTPREFRGRFTVEEKGALTLAASKGLEAGDPSLQVFIDDLAATQVVELDHPELIAGMDALVAAKLLTRKRADAILAA